MSRKRVRVGILHSQTGTMALSEKPLIDAALLAIAQINQTGGILGQYIEPIVVDGASDSAEFERLAKNLIQTQQVNTVFGCWTSAARKAVKPVFERLNALLWYPVQYEGLERSPNIFYTGSCPNQQVEPAVNWLLQNQGKRFYLLGSDYVFPRTVNKLICSQLKQHQAEVVGQKYAALGEANFTEIIAQIRQTRPDVVFNTLNGDSNQFFYQQYQAAGITAEKIPIFAVSVAESELQYLKETAVGHYASWSYFQSLDSPENQRFVEDFQAKYGANRVTCDAIEAAYSQVYLWKQAVEAAESFEVERVRVAAYGQSFAAPGGLITIEPNHHVAKYCRIGQVLENGQFEIIYSSKTAIKPLPWLGVEELNFDKSELVIEMLSQVSQGIQQTWQLEQKSRQLEVVAQELQQTQAAMQESAIALRSHNLVLTYIAKNPALHQGDLKAALIEITEASAQNLQVERASVWLFDATGTKLECLDLFEKSQNQHSQGLELIATEYPAYFQALLQDQAIVANNVDNNPRTQELADYLRAFGITSLLDTAITIKGQMAGVISLEQVGIARDWTLEDQNFVRSLTDLVSLAIEARERKLAEAALRQNEARWQLVLRGTGDGIFDWNISTGETFASDRLLSMLGYTAQELAYSYETWRSLVHPEDLELAMSALQAHLEGKSELYRSEFRLRCQDGSYKWILARGQAQWDDTGKPVRMLGSHQDISDVYDKLRLRQQVAEEVQLLLTISQAISAAPDFDTALEVALQQVCQTTNWIYGEAWVPTTTESTLLHSPCCYYQPTETEAIKRFRDYSEVLTFSVGEEIPGTVLATSESQWIDSFSELDDVLLRLELATECGFKKAFGVPIIALSNLHQETEQQASNLLSSQSSLLAVLVFFIRESRFNDQRLIQLVNVIAAQLGGVLQQKKVQAEMKALFAAMTDVVTVRDASGRCLNVIPTNPNLYKPSASMIGRTLDQDLPPAQANLILKGILKAIMSQKTVVIEYCLPIDDKEVWLAERISPLSEETAILVAQDISEAVAAEAQRKLAEAALRLEQEKSERLLRNILPAKIVQQLKQCQGVIAQQFDDVTILFADLVGFTPLSSRLNPIELVNLLDEIFSIFDELAERLGLEKIKTIGDAYMVAAGLPTPRIDHAQAIADMALAMQAAMECFQSEQAENIQIRLGINSGVVVAGVIGKKKFIYDLWGDAVNVASRMESSGTPGKIQVTTATYNRLKSQYLLEKRGTIEIKGKGEMVTYWLVGKNSK
ncbi:MAG: transporter substrate-binding protein [Coleofasciculaceae cyanobacterium]